MFTCFVRIDGFVNTKKAAITAIGALAEHTEEAFFPFLQRTLTTFLTPDQGTLFSYHKSVRAETISTFSSLLQSGCSHFGISTQPGKGQIIVLPEDLEDMRVHLAVSCLHTITIDGEKLPVAQSMEQVMLSLLLLYACNSWSIYSSCIW